MANYSTDCTKIHANAKILVRGFLFARDFTSFEIAQQTFRLAMVSGFFTETSGFRQVREGLVAAAGIAFGTSTGAKIGKGFDQVGITANVNVPGCK